MALFRPPWRIDDEDMFNHLVAGFHGSEVAAAFADVVIAHATCPVAIVTSRSR
jgi:hypothetical protein